MRRIKISDRIKVLAQSYSDIMEDEHYFGTDNSPKARLNALSRALRNSSAKISILKKEASKGHHADYVHYKGSEFQALSNYVMAIHDHYDGLNKLLPSEYTRGISQYVEPFLSGYDLSGIKVKLPKRRLQSFYELIVDAMRYDKVQKDIMPRYVRQLGVKTCVYCNAQFAATASIQKVKTYKKGAVRIKNVDVSCYELDHNMAKSKYPYLCTNFFNLQPSCGSCNRRKNDRDLGFFLYYEEGETDIKPLHIALAPSDIIRFRTTNDGTNIKPYLCNNGEIVPPDSTDYSSTAGRFNQMLGIQGIYDEHKDIVEEILWKHKIYSAGFMSAAINQMKSLGLVGFDVKRFILGGYYGQEDDFLKRPMSIMNNDIWEQLNKEMK